MESVSGKALRDLDAATRLAVDRTRLAYERTLMAWIRTATTLITFGLALQKLFQVQETERATTRGGLLGPHNLALLMIGIGLVALVIATLEHRRDLNALKADYRDIPTSLARVLAALVSVLGILAFISALLRQ